MNDRSLFHRLFVGAMLMNVPFFKSSACLRRIKAYGLPITYNQLAAHHLAGGRISSWVEGLIYAQEHGIKLDRDNAAARDLLAAHGSGITLVEHLQILEKAGIRDAFRAPLDSLEKKNG